MSRTYRKKYTQHGRPRHYFRRPQTHNVRQGELASTLDLADSGAIVPVRAQVRANVRNHTIRSAFDDITIAAAYEVPREHVGY